MTLATWIETDCTYCCGTGRVEQHEREGLVEVRCDDCGGRGRHDATVDCEFCDQPVDSLGFCRGCDEFAPGFAGLECAA